MKNVFAAFLLLKTLAVNAQQDSIPRISPQAFSQAVSAEGTQLLDVRTFGEFSAGHIRNALQADWTSPTQFHDRVAYIDKNKPVYVYCLVGGRSAAAATWMRQNGFTNVIELAGGMNAWRAAGNPVDGTNPEPQMTMEQYRAKIPKDKTVLVDVGATWCPPCVKMEPVLTELKQTAGKSFEFVRIDAGIHIDLLKSLGIDQLPVFLVYKNGNEIWRKSGITSIMELKTHLQ